MAQGRGDLPLAYFDAMCPVEASVESAEWEENAARFEAQHWRGTR